MLNWTYYGNALQDWLTAVITAAAAYLFLWLLRRVALAKLRELAQMTSTQLDNLITDVLQRTGWRFAAYLSFYIGSRYLVLPGDTERLLHSLLIIFVALQVAVWGHHLIADWLVHYFKKKHADDQAVQTMIGAMAFLGRFALFSLLFLMVLQNLGFRIDTLLTALGIGGIAVAQLPADEGSPGQLHDSCSVSHVT